MSSLVLPFLLVASLVAPPADDAPRPSLDDVPELAGLRDRWAAALETLAVPGAAIAVIRDGEVVALEGFGVRDVDGAPVTPDTMFYIASITKTYVATAVTSLAAHDALDLDAPVADTLPRFALADPDATASITIRDLLCHRAGLQCGPIVVLDAYTGEITDDRYYHWLSTVDPLGATSYSNIHYTLLGRVLEAHSGDSWKDHLQRELFEPLGLSRTTAYASRMYADPDHAAPLEPDGDGFRRCDVRKDDSVMHAAGGVGTSARDGAAWLLAQLDGGALETRGLLDRDALHDMRARHGVLVPEGRIRRLDGFGLGWRRGTFRDRPYLVHGGGYLGTAAHMSLLPEHGHGVVVLTNVAHGGALCDVVSIDVYDRLLGETGHEDLLPLYEERLAARLAERGDDADGFGPLRAEHLTRDLDAYVGRYVDRDWGTFTVRRDGNGLLAHFGRIELAFEPVSPDRFFIRGGGIDLEGLFMPGDDVSTLVLTDDERLMRFERE